MPRIPKAPGAVFVSVDAIGPHRVSEKLIDVEKEADTDAADFGRDWGRPKIAGPYIRMDLLSAKERKRLAGLGVTYEGVQR